MNAWHVGILLSVTVGSGCHDDRGAESADDHDGKLTPASGTDGRRAVPAPSHVGEPLTTTEEISNERVTTQSGPPPVETATAAVQASANATFLSDKANPVKGSAAFAETAQGVQIRVQIAGAPPGEKGLHIHQSSDCSDIPGKSMGAHFEGETSEHGLPEDGHHHIGDLGNIRIASDGTGLLEVVVSKANLRSGDPLSFIDRSLVLHEKRDDGSGDSGNSGKAIACAPILVARQ